jgi:hypothetical protein
VELLKGAHKMKAKPQISKWIVKCPMPNTLAYSGEVILSNYQQASLLLAALNTLVFLATGMNVDACSGISNTSSYQHASLLPARAKSFATLATGMNVEACGDITNT